MLASAQRAGDHGAAAAALRAVGLAVRQLEDLAAADEALRRSVGLARRHGLRTREGEARLSRALVLALAGRPEAGRREAARAAVLLTGPAAGRAHAQEALILQLLGRYDEALAGYRRALATFRRAGLDDDVARVRTNRGIVHAYRGHLQAARTDLEAARQTYLATDKQLAAAEAVHNLGWVAALGGDVPMALRRYDEAAEDFRRLGVDRVHCLLDRAEALLAAGLAPDAHATAAKAVAVLESEGGMAHAEALLACARAALAGGDLAAAGATAARAERRFRRQARRPWAAVAAFVALQAEVAGGRTVPAARAGALADELEAAGWGAAALDARLLAGEAALAAGRDDVAAEHLAAAAAARRSPLAERRVRAWHAEALLRLRSGRRAAALRALDAGLDALAENRAALGATELRAGLARHGQALARLGVGLALSTRSPPAVLRWAERSRTAMGPPPPEPHDPVVEQALARLRATTGELEQATFSADGRAARLRRQCARLEGAVRAAALRAPPGPAPTGVRPPTVAVLRAALGERALIELVVSGGTVHAVVVDRRGALLRPLCAEVDVGREVAHLRFALTRLATAGHGTADGSRAAGALAASARRVSDLVLAPLLERLGDAPLVVVPTGPLHGLPWGVLPPLRGRPVVVAPSAAAWLRATGRAGSAMIGGATALVAGPGLAGAAREVQRLAAVHPGARSLRGPGATVAATAAALTGAPLAHVAAHGSFRGDNPRFSSLRLADGPLLVHDLERLPAPPRTVVLSACHAAEAVVTAGDEVVGLAGALLGLGTGSVVASVAPVPDGPAIDWVVRLHRALAGGRPPAEALAATTEVIALDGAAGAAAALIGFVCYGAG